MKRILTSTLFLSLTIALIPADTILGTSQIRAAGSQSQRRISIRTIVSPRAPVSVRDATAAAVDDDQIVLQYAVNNQSGGQLTEFEMIAYVLGKDGRVKGGEGWTVRDKVAQNYSRSFSRTMKTKLAREDRLVLTVWRASGEAGTFEIDRKELDNLLHLPAASSE